MSIDIYTEQERIFLVKVLELVNAEYETERIDDTISFIKFKITTDAETQGVIKQIMLWNYKKNFN